MQPDSSNRIPHRTHELEATAAHVETARSQRFAQLLNCHREHTSTRVNAIEATATTTQIELASPPSEADTLRTEHVLGGQAPLV